MDEIGRGTSTFDGLALAGAIAHHLHEKNRAFTLFATHYFELISLAEELPGCANVHLDATEHADSLVFLHAVKEGPANRSFGLQVAQLAGVPREVIATARHYMRKLEGQRTQSELPLFAGAPLAPSSAQPVLRPDGALRARLQQIDPDQLTPRAAHALLYELRKLLRDDH
jgi:DNA mismatch repair protein MutS